MKTAMEVRRYNVTYGYLISLLCPLMKQTGLDGWFVLMEYWEYILATRRTRDRPTCPAPNTTDGHTAMPMPPLGGFLGCLPAFLLSVLISFMTHSPGLTR